MPIPGPRLSQWVVCSRSEADERWRRRDRYRYIRLGTGSQQQRLSRQSSLHRGKRVEAAKHYVIVYRGFWNASIQTHVTVNTMSQHFFSDLLHHSNSSMGISKSKKKKKKKGRRRMQFFPKGSLNGYQQAWINGINFLPVLYKNMKNIVDDKYLSHSFGRSFNRSAAFRSYYYRSLFAEIRLRENR